MNNTPRSGITLVEVLTSIIVAVIGVAGVLVLIPFAIRQSEVGIDLDESTNLAENAAALFEISGYNRVSQIVDTPSLPWIDQTIVGGGLVPANFSAASCLWIDPLWISRLNPTAAQIDAMFNDINGGNAAVFQNGEASSGMIPLQPRFATLIDMADGTGGVAINRAIAARMFQAQDDLQFAFDQDPITGLELDDLSPPRQYVDVNAANVPVRRQFRGEMTWSAVAVPRQGVGGGGVVEGYDFHVLVYKDRSFEDPTPGAFLPSRDPRMPYATVANAGMVNIAILGAGTIEIASPIDLQADQWIMLVNINANGVPQVGFFRVIGADPATSRVTIDGSNFLIPPTADQTTFAIALTNVVNVFKRQLRLESVATFNE